MKKKLFILAVVSLMVCLIGFVAVASACEHGKPKDCRSKPGELCFYQKVPGEVDDCSYGQDSPTGSCSLIDCGVGYKCLVQSSNPLYPCVPCFPLGDEKWVTDTDGAWGKMKYNLSGQIFNFEFEGHGLTKGKSYTLIYYPEYLNWGLIYLGSDIAAGKNGHVNIKGSLDTGSLPVPYDCNHPQSFCPRYDDPARPTGAKIWLVPSADVCFRTLSPPEIINWNLEEYLFGAKLITFHDTDQHCE